LAEEPGASPADLEQTLSYARELGALYAEWKAQVDTVEHRSLHDGLTDLPNRTLLRRRIEETIRGRSADAGSLALLLMDLDRFKQINDTLGHHNGDLLLQEVAARLSGLGRGERTIARLGGDEFAVLLPTGNSTSATLVAQEILAALREPFILEGLSVEAEASIGIVLSPDHGADVDTLLRRADVAMYLAKAAESGCRLYAPEDDPHSPSRLALAAELRRAIETDELLLHYLPRVNCRTSRIDAVEALVRWEHPRHGLMGPDQFIPLAESTGLIRPLTLRVLDAALRQARAWRKARMNLGMAVNLSARDFQDPTLAHRIDGLLATWQVEPARLTLEVTERVVMVDEVRVRESMAGLRDIGVRFAIDDFGTGYSSLARLKDLPVDELKIDKSFVTDMASNAKDAAIVRSSIELGHNLGLQVVAEGVENRDTWNLLVTLGCDAAQGYYLSRPIPAAQLTRARTRAPVGIR
jgi:diguanylate cyclase (GGDEF)-like protein